MQKENPSTVSELTELAISISKALGQAKVQESLTNVFKNLQKYYIKNGLNMQGIITCEAKEQLNFKEIIEILNTDDQDQTKIGFLADLLFEMNVRMVAAPRPQVEELNDIVTLLTKGLKETKSIAMGVPKEHKIVKLAPNVGDNPIENDVEEEGVYEDSLNNSVVLQFNPLEENYGQSAEVKNPKNQEEDNKQSEELTQLANQFSDDILKREDIKKDLLQIFKDIQEYCKEKKINVHGRNVDAPLVLDEKYDVASIINSLKKEQTKKQQVSLLLDNLFNIDMYKTRNGNIHNQNATTIMNILNQKLQVVTERIKRTKPAEKPAGKPAETKPKKRGGCFPFCGKRKVQKVTRINKGTVNNANDENNKGKQI